MSPRDSAVRLMLCGMVVIAAGCSRQEREKPGGGGYEVIVDREVRGYIEQSLRPYLTSLAKTACAVRAYAAPRGGRYGLCVSGKGGAGMEPLIDPKGEWVTLPPKDGRPFPPPDSLRGRDSVDNEVSRYIEDSLLPYVASLARVTCTVRAKAAPRAGAYGICLRKPGQAAASAQNPQAETITPPPKNRTPYPPGKVRPASDNEVRIWIETQLRPYLISVAKVSCETRAAVYGGAGRYGICVLGSPGAKNVEPIQGTKGEVITIPPKDGKPYPTDSFAPGTQTPRR
jgi:hypothetical protein